MIHDFAPASARARHIAQLLGRACVARAPLPLTPAVTRTCGVRLRDGLYCPGCKARLFRQEAE